MTGYLILDAIYVVIALAALAMTRAEARASGPRSTMETLLGYLACAAWPVTLVIIAGAMTVADRAPSDDNEAEREGAVA